MSTEYVIAEIAAERERQKSVEGWTPEHDDEHVGSEMARARSPSTRCPNGHAISRGTICACVSGLSSGRTSRRGSDATLCVPPH